ncbi:NADP-dependent oxidoreductase [Sporosarcina sp. YIM B06819]|uniref:NADP-dependent oxidoreductase n=1 Tax=Sporosarcina sp. YIM B06819 TaxID=3081769 RepID=UPI00298CB158|nr:NADP-dependent oxidoreductase [Sporosarcina sp. YIM B06819]
METMKAFAITTKSQSNELSLLDIPVPAIEKNEVLVRVKAIGVGIHDRWFTPADPVLPYVIGIEAAGEIVKIGESVTDFAIGDRVMFISGMQLKGGTWAEFASVNEDALINIPDNLQFVDAAAIPVAGTAALEGMKALKATPGDTVFIAGASGAIGTLAIQLAVARGYRVVSSASAQNHAYMLTLGAECVVDYRDADWANQVKQWMPRGVDAALAIQPGTGVTSMGIVKDGGKVVTISGDQFLAERQIIVEQITNHPETKKELSQLASEAASGQLRIVVEHVYPFEQGVEALKKVESRHVRGKIVLSM